MGAINTTILKDAWKYLPAYIIPSFVGFIAIPIVTRLFTTHEYGQFMLVIAVSTVATVISSAWVNAPLVRFWSVYSKNTEEKEAFLAIVIKLLLVAGFALSLIFVVTGTFAVKWLPQRFHNIIWIILSLSLCDMFWRVACGKLRATREIGQYVWFTIWYSVVGITTGILLVAFFSFGIEGLLFGRIFSMVLMIGFLRKKAFGDVDMKRGKLASEMTLKMIKYGAPFAIIDLATWIINLSDRYIIRFYYDSAKVGLYSANYGIAEKIVYLVVFVFVMAESPVAFGKWESSPVEENKKLSEKVTRYYIVFAVPLTIGISVLAKPLISVLTPAGYRSGYVIMPFVAVSILLLGVFHRYYNVLALHKRTRVYMYIVSGACIANIVMNFIFVPLWGYTAAAKTTLFSYSAMLVLSIVISRRYMVWNFPFRSLARSCIASAIMSLVVIFCGNICGNIDMIKLFSIGLVGSGVYFLSLYLLSEFNEQEKEYALNLLKDVLRIKASG